MNGFRGRVDVENAIVSHADGNESFFVYGESMAASVSRANVEDLNPERRTSPADQISQRAVTLDSYCRQRDVWPDVVKIDVEGAEYRVLRGARHLLSTRRPVILCEIHPRQMENCGSSVADVREYLGELGYRLEALDDPNTMGIFHAALVHESPGWGAPRLLRGR